MWQSGDVASHQEVCECASFEGLTVMSQALHIPACCPSWLFLIGGPGLALPAEEEPL